HHSPGAGWNADTESGSAASSERSVVMALSRSSAITAGASGSRVIDGSPLGVILVEIGRARVHGVRGLDLDRSGADVRSRRRGSGALPDSRGASRRARQRDVRTGQDLLDGRAQLGRRERLAEDGVEADARRAVDDVRGAVRGHEDAGYLRADLP